jgi:hypothetical protein
MWRENGGIVTYAYYPDKPVSIRCGEDWFWNAKLQSGKWHHIKIWMKLNTLSGGTANEDGQFKAWLDGTQVGIFACTTRRTSLRPAYCALIFSFTHLLPACDHTKL